MSNHQYTDECGCRECVAAFEKRAKKAVEAHIEWSNQQTADRAQQRGK